MSFQRLQDSRPQLKNLAEYSGEDKIISSYEMQLALNESEDTSLNVKSQIPSLDHYVEGFQSGELIVISGVTKSGKTLLAQTFTHAFAKQQYTPLWFTFEVPARQFIKQFHDLPLFYMPSKLRPNAMDWFRERCEESFLKYHTRIIFIDHLHFLFDLARTKSPSIEIGQIVRHLKTLAVEKEWIIFLICHTVKAGVNDEVGFDKIRDSGFVACESDCVLMVARVPKRGENRANLKVEFHRRTGVLEKCVQLEKVKGYLMEYKETTDQPLGYRDD